MENNFCKYCINYKKPICKISNEFTSRKYTCDLFKLSKNKKYNIIKKKEKNIKKSDKELKNIIFNENITIPNKPEYKRSRKQRRK